MSDNVSAEFLRRRGQIAVADHLSSLGPDDRGRLESELATVDFDLLERLIESTRLPAPPAPERIAPPSVVVKGAHTDVDARARTLGEALIARGGVAAVMVAGGQGSRLGHPGPKGTYPATAIQRKPLFRVFAEKLAVAARRWGRPVPWCIMTSEENHRDTVDFFESHRHFGLDPSTVHFFTQGMLPAVTPDGALVLKDRVSLFRSPDGHGGTLRALRRSGLLDTLAAQGVEQLSYFQVDNPLVDVVDPVFLGHHLLARSEFSSKAVSKAGPEEKVGVFAVADDLLTVIEYSDLPARLREAVHPDGRLVFAAGSIAIHAIALDFVARITKDGLDLPFHLARKKLAVTTSAGEAASVDGIKFETFVFDALVHAATPLVMEVAREREFAPIKNATGVDSAESSLALQSALFASWLDAAGCRVPRDAGGAPLHPIEISPLFADSAEALRRRLSSPLRIEGPTYLGDAE